MTRFSKKFLTIIFEKIRPSRSRSVPCGRAGGATDRQTLRGKWLLYATACTLRLIMNVKRCGRIRSCPDLDAAIQERNTVDGKL